MAAMGFVSLVGAGPGDPDLLTQRAVRRLAEADVVFYDALVSLDVLPLAPRAQLVSVGKRHGRHSVSQEGIHRCLVRAARRGKRVVRLKAGDPFVFGRGGEEALALITAGIPFDVVPGVSSAVAAPALAGIPVTHRGLASSFVVVSGHAPAAWEPIVDGLLPRTSTLVVLMGIHTRAAIANRLIQRGWPPTTPAAVLFAASTPQAQRWLGTLRDLSDDQPLPIVEAGGVAASTPDGPGTIVIGEVVRLAHVLAPEASDNLGVGARHAVP